MKVDLCSPWNLDPFERTEFRGRDGDAVAPVLDNIRLPAGLRLKEVWRAGFTKVPHWVGLKIPSLLGIFSSLAHGNADQIADV